MKIKVKALAQYVEGVPTPVGQYVVKLDGAVVDADEFAAGLTKVVSSQFPDHGVAVEFAEGRVNAVVSRHTTLSAMGLGTFEEAGDDEEAVEEYPGVDEDPEDLAVKAVYNSLNPLREP